MDFLFDATLKQRQLFKGFLDRFSLEDLNKIPAGFSNNIFWNVSHIEVTQQLLVYNLSGVKMLVNDDLVAKYRKGTKTVHNASQAEVDEIKDLLFSSIEKTKEDYSNGVFKNYKEYSVSTGSTLTNANDAIVFNNFHEGIHYGYILALIKAL